MNIYLVRHLKDSRTFLVSANEGDLDQFEVVEEITDINKIGLHELAILVDNDLKELGIHNLVGIGDAMALDLAKICGSIPAKRFLFALIKGDLRTSKFFGEC